MNATELFPPEIVAMDNPRLAWLKKHNLALMKQEEGGKEHPDSGEIIPLWVCLAVKPTMPSGLYAPRDIGGGGTADEACVGLAINRGIPLWNET